MEKLKEVVFEYEGSETSALNNNSAGRGKKSKKRKREVEEEKSTDSSSSESGELSKEEPKSRSVRSKGLKVATRSRKRFKTSDEIDWKSYAIIKDQERKLKEIPEDVIDYFKDPEPRQLIKHFGGGTYNKQQQSKFPKYKADLPFNDKKRLQCIVCQEKTAEYGNNTCRRAVMCASCAATSVWWPTPLFD